MKLCVGRIVFGSPKVRMYVGVFNSLEFAQSNKQCPVMLERIFFPSRVLRELACWCAVCPELLVARKQKAESTRY